MAESDSTRPVASKVDQPFYDRLVPPPLLERRLWAATVDMALPILCATALFHSFGPLSKGPLPWLWKSTAVILSAAAVLEAATGKTLGKLLAKLQVRRRDGGTPGHASLALRATVKYVPVAIFIASLSLETMGFLLVAITGFTLAIAEVQACYLTIMRGGLTIYDHLTGTKVAKTGDAGEGGL